MSRTAPDISRLTTESVDESLADLDTRSVAELAATMNRRDHDVPRAVEAALPQISAAIEAVVERMERGGRLVYVGAGTPGRLGVLDASECVPTFNTPPELVTGLIAGGAQALTTAVEGAEDSEELGRDDVLALGLRPEDTVVGIASSGRTPYVVSAVRTARAAGALTVGLSCNPGAELSQLVEHAIEVVVGPELITGSTRLKSGTAQKLVLNMISTITMIRLGKTYGNLMVDVRASNEKLVARATGIVQRITGVDAETASAVLHETDLQVKDAVVRLRLGVSTEEARARLQAAGGRLRVALGEA
ncbi:N-acetylmuramic acid 6-phosphate etherase [Auraticoccus sp. F435]|uniref:N-acetylmuramic acid 6-phosphate etherase n=1 Tax=Auraticoccus cholistanensis TaxID=2656650 RepID=A0A6A9V001_9ACTN|nr:N-acetylmuramic acid 6-phosphate etherase [Auraticoccus cholistanensis]MVA74729.1 N-acetylmuramic acid 6-phosphate etherase [Auraticoccus cholistanensis]